MILHQIQQQIKAPKGQFNAHGKFNFRSYADILAALKPICGELGVTIHASDEITFIGNLHFLKAVVQLLDKEGKVIATGQAFAGHPVEQKGMNFSQITGSASSYARKYAIEGILAIDDGNDADSITPPKAKPEQDSKLDREGNAVLKIWCDSKNRSSEAFNKYIEDQFNITNKLGSLTASEVQTIKNALGIK